MAVTNRRIIAAKYTENVQTTQYTTPAATTTVVDKFTITNVTGAAATISVHLVTTGGTADASNVILDERGIAPGETFDATMLAGHVIEPGGFISTLAGTASALVISASGREIT